MYRHRIIHKAQAQAQAGATVSDTLLPTFASCLTPLQIFRPPKEVTVLQSVDRFWAGRNADDLLTLFLTLVQNTVRDVEAVKHTVEATSFAVVQCMLTNCRDPILACVGDATCKAGLDCLDQCDRRDQVRPQCLPSH